MCSDCENTDGPVRQELAAMARARGCDLNGTPLPAVQWYALLRSAAAVLRGVMDGTVGPDDLAVVHVEGDIEAALAPYPTSASLPSRGYPLTPQGDAT